MMLIVLLMLVLVVLTSSCGKKLGFKKLDPTQSGINFNNLVIENDLLNIIDLEFVYNGGGVAIADCNNNG